MPRAAREIATEMLRWYRRALAQSPAFSVRWAPVARKAVS
jgi:hypothetical protein